jgi:hypothetical protein
MIPPYTPVDREAIWDALFTYLRGKLWAPPWAPSTAYAPGDVRTDPQGHLQKVTTPGTSGAAAPAWNDAGGTTADNDIVWQDTGAGFVSMGRKHIAPPDLVTAAQPACFVIGVKETHNPRPRGVPTKLTLRGMLILYAPAPVADEDIGAETQLGATFLNDLFFAIDAALEPDNVVQGVFTLGGLVSDCWIEGDTDLDPGIFGSQAAAILPIHILVP